MNDAIKLLSESEGDCQIYANESRLKDFIRGVELARQDLLRSNGINWEKRRYEIAKDIFATSRVAQKIGKYPYIEEEEAEYAVRLADLLIKELKKDNLCPHKNTKSLPRLCKRTAIRNTEAVCLTKTSIGAKEWSTKKMKMATSNHHIKCYI